MFYILSPVEQVAQFNNTVRTSKMITDHQIPPIKGLELNLLILTWTGCLLGLIMFVLRIYVNAFITKRWTLDFWFALPTFVSLVLPLNLQFSNSYLGYGCPHVGNDESRGSLWAGNSSEYFTDFGP